jgi:GTP-binding protein HflX
MREIAMLGIEKAILSDTVGFISELPTQLVAAFRATLEEVISADLIIHVRDISHPDTDAQRLDVEQVLTEIGAMGAPDVDGEGEAKAIAPLIEAWNKVDMLGGEERERIDAEAARRDNVVPMSALSGEGVDRLIRSATERLREGSRLRRVTLPSSAGEAIAWLHANGEIVDQRSADLETEFEVRISDKDWARFESHHLRQLT